MLRVMIERLRQKHRTIPWPKRDPALPDRMRGRPALNSSACSHCSKCVEACPVNAISIADGKRSIDLGRCLFCDECARACPNGCIKFQPEYRMAARKRDDLVLSGGEYALAAALEEKSRRIFGRSLKLRQVSAGGCNACEADVNVLGTVVFDLGRFGVQFVASPRHADGLLVTGPVTQNMKTALEKTYAAVPDPKLVIAVGACAISGGPYASHCECNDGVDKILPVDLYIPGCPPHPMTTLDGIVRLLGQL